MADGSTIVGLFNRHDVYNEIVVNFRELGFKHPVKAHDVWANKDLGKLPLEAHFLIQGHDVILLRVKQ
jgi:hypothetical protein